MSTANTNTSTGSSSRREFLKLSGGAAAATALTGTMASRCHAGESSAIKLALVGCGGRGTGAVGNAFATTGGPVKLHAMADLFEHRLKGSLGVLANRFKDEVNVPAERQFLGFDAYKKAIDSLDPGDVVLLTTHAAFRPLHLEYAVNRGVNVFAEKSFATDSPNARRWLKAAEASEKKKLKRSASASCGDTHRPGRRSSSEFTTGPSATCIRCGSTASTGRFTARGGRKTPTN